MTAEVYDPASGWMLNCPICSTDSPDPASSCICESECNHEFCAGWRTGRNVNEPTSWTPEERALLAGMVGARASVYIGKSARNGRARYSPGVAVEVPEPHPLLDAVMGQARERRYYGRSTYRYQIQDRQRIETLVGLVDPWLPEKMRWRMGRMVVFLADPSENNFIEFQHNT